MIRLLHRDKSFKFYPLDYSEKKNKIVNPLRGWYKIFYFDIAETPDYSFIESQNDDSQKLVMAFVDISSVKDEDIDEKCRENFKSIIRYFVSKNKDVILRFAYDHVGRAMEKEPSSFKTVLKHADELISLVNESNEGIFIIQGLLVGNWGEMHSSRYIYDQKLTELYEIYKKSDKRIFLSVRKPLQWRMLNLNFAKTGSMENIRTGIFNDGMFGSDTDLGTYGFKSKEEVGFRSEWNVKEEREFLNAISKNSPVGGEVVLDKEKNNPDVSFMISTLKDTGVSYLNSEHDKDLINLWKSARYTGSGIFNGDSVYDYVDAHLGYRFVIENVKVKKDRNGILTISVTIKNNGFAPVYFDCDVYLEISDSAEAETHAIKAGLNDLFNGDRKTVSASFLKDKGLVTLYAKRSENNETVYFASDFDEKGRVLLGKIDE
ncbi:MAG: DUF4832 domain-containing protein [Lachnospiraceae bacterium]|nr:DUF4832 domain-containing protein [Lachnospiraceae bacterium]